MLTQKNRLLIKRSCSLLAFGALLLLFSCGDEASVASPNSNPQPVQEKLVIAQATNYQSAKGVPVLSMRGETSKDTLSVLADTDATGAPINMSGVFFSDSSNNSMKIDLNTEGLPARIDFSQSDVFLTYTDYVDNVVTLKIYDGQTNLLSSERITLDAAKLKQLKTLRANLNTAPAAFTLDGPEGFYTDLKFRQGWEPSRYLELASVVVQVGLCTSALATTPFLGFTWAYACGSALLSTISLFVEDPLLQLSANTVSFGGCAVILYKLFSKDFISLLGHFSSLKDCLATVLDWIATVDQITTKKEYSVLFDSLEGEWVKPKQVKEGETVERPSDPSRRGYVFRGWYRDLSFSRLFSFSTEINGNLTLYAKWEKVTTGGGGGSGGNGGGGSGGGGGGGVTTYTVSFSTGSGATVVGSQRVTKGERATQPSTPQRSGYRFAGWYRDSEFNNYFSFYSEINADLTLYARWSRGDYTVTFEANGGSGVSSQRVDRGSKATPPTPSKSGYVFAGWYKDRGLTQPFSLYTPIMENITLYARWTVSLDFNTLKAAGNILPRGIWSDGTTMWVVDRYNDKIYAYRMSDKARDSSKDLNTLYAAGNTWPEGIWSDGTTMWVAESRYGKIYAYNLSTKARDSDKDFNTLKAAGNILPRGIWSDGTTMWVVGDRKIFAYNLKTKTRDSDKDFNTLSAAGNTGSEDIWSDGTTMWVSDIGDDKIYAYRMSDKTRDPDKDFNTLKAAGNEHPTGLWSDGTTMWVGDWNDRKIYAYSRSTKQRTP